jgi:Flp pilus assembly protein TadB
MAWDHPVCVNYHEAAAFATWKSKRSGKNLRVITELEHRAIRDSIDADPILSHAPGALDQQVGTTELKRRGSASPCIVLYGTLLTAGYCIKMLCVLVLVLVLVALAFAMSCLNE